MTPKNFKRFDYTVWRAHYYETAVLNGIKLEGDCVELGVWYGLYSRVVISSDAFKKSGKTFHLVDSFGFNSNELKKLVLKGLNIKIIFMMLC